MAGIANVPDGREFPCLRRDAYGWGFLVLGLAVTAIYLGASFWIASQQRTLWLYVFSTVVSAVLVALVLALARGLFKCRLWLDGEGIRYDGVGFRVSAPWARVSATRDALGRPQLHLDDPTATFDGWLGAIKTVVTGVGIIPAPALAVMLDRVPLHIFTKDWPDGELARAIGTYAPGLLLTPRR